jgi:hypothetical protein
MGIFRLGELVLSNCDFVSSLISGGTDDLRLRE